MKKIFLIASLAILMSCNNSKDDHAVHTPKSFVDSLYDQVMEGHDIGMAKMGKLSRARNEVNRLLDSLQKLPAKAREASRPYKAKLDNLLADLDRAETNMNNWMDSFKWDSAVNNTQKRIEYLQSEMPKVAEIKNSILNSLQKADSLLQKKI